MQEQTTPAAPAATATQPAAAQPSAGQPAPATQAVTATEAATQAAVEVEAEATGPAAALRALEAHRSELRDQLRRVERQREEVLGQVRRVEERGLGETGRQGLEARLAQLDARLVSLDREIATADAAVAQAAAVPGAVVETPPPPVRHSSNDEEMVIVGMFLAACVLFPLSLAYARRLWRRSATAVASLPAELAQRLTRLEQGVDAMAIEVERISEGQRFMTRIFTESTDRRALGAHAPAGDGLPADTSTER